tara:strand:- start:955 stop:1779 length:825 start_codon:yes stop_codon:yes gene_type:complete
MKKYSLILLLNMSLVALAHADNHIDDWTDNQLCGWMQSSAIPKYISDEVGERELYCIDGISSDEEVNVVEVVVELTVVEVEKEVEEEPITSANEDLSFGISAAKQGDFNGAIDYLTASLKKNPNNAVAYYFLGKTFAKLGGYSKALENYKKALELNKRYTEVYNSLGVLYASQGNIRQSIESYSKAISYNKNYVSPYINRGVLHYNQGLYQKALYDFTKVLEIEPNSTQALINRANVYSSIGAKDAVCEDLQRLCLLGNCKSLNNLLETGYCKN